jgi:hypothetical protein
MSVCIFALVIRQASCVFYAPFYTLILGLSDSTTVVYTHPLPVWLYINFMLSSVACLALQKFNGMIFGEKLY